MAEAEAREDRVARASAGRRGQGFHPEARERVPQHLDRRLLHRHPAEEQFILINKRDREDYRQQTHTSIRCFISFAMAVNSSIQSDEQGFP